MGVDRRLLTSLSILIVLIVTACGTTVPAEQQELAEAIAETGEDLGGALPEGATINEKGQVVSETGEVLGDAEDFGISTDSSGSVTTADSSDTDTGDTTGTTERVDPGENGPGITASTIKIGVAYADDAEEANAAVGATSGASQINTRRAYEAMIDYVNANGGVAGRKLEPVFHRLSATSTEPYDQQDQEVCAHWTQDDPVFVGDGGFKTENGVACMQKAGMVTITTNGLRFKSNAFFERYPTYLEFDGVDNDSIARIYADNMKKMGLFDEGYKLGIVSWTESEYANPTKNVLVPRLQQLGIEVSDVTYITTPDSGGEAAGPIAQVGNTAVRYKGDGITHVMFMDLGANLAFFFMQAAQRQQYFPRYGLHSGSGGTALANLLKSGGDQEARQQLEDAVAVGWVPSLELRQEDIPSWAQSTASKVCYKQMREGGVEMNDSNARSLALAVCDAIWTIQATLDAIPGNVINQQTWYQGLARLNAMNVQLTGGMGFNITQTRRDGIEYAAQVKFFADCVCFKYTSGRFEIPD